MKNKLIFAGLLIGVLAIGMVLVSCDTGGGGGETPPNDEVVAGFLRGTWLGDNNGATLVFSGNNQFERTTNNNYKTSGPYTITKTNDTTGSLGFASNRGTWSGRYSYEITSADSPFKIKLTHTTGQNEINTGENGRVIIWTKQ